MTENLSFRLAGRALWRLAKAYFWTLLVHAERRYFAVTYVPGRVMAGSAEHKNNKGEAVMMTVKRGRRALRGNAVAVRHGKGLVAGVFLLSALPLSVAQAFQVKSGDWTTSFDTTVSYGVNYRMEDQSKKLISKVNGGSTNAPINSDDGNLNFRKGELFSEVAKIVSEVDLNYQDRYGVFVRGRAFYDFELEDDQRRHRQISDDGLDEAGSGADLLDAFVYGAWDINERPLTARLGRQVVNWGESLFAQGGIAATNPFDVSALRAPGSEIKEAFLPTLMGYLSYELKDGLTVEGYWQPGSSWEETKIDTCGTFFSGTDVLGEGCNYLTVTALQEAITSQLGASTVFDNPQDLEAYLAGLPGFLQGPAGTILGSTFIPRGRDVKADDDAQYGLALRWFVPELNNTEFGLYYLRYSTQTPVVSATVGQMQNFPMIGPLFDASSARYFAEYFGKRDLYGISFNTSVPGDGPLGGMAVAGELSYRPDSIVGIYTPNIIGEAVLGQCMMPGVPAGCLEAGTYLPGYVERDRLQASVSAIYNLSAGVLGSDSGSLIGEVMANRIMGSLDAKTFDNPDLTGGTTNSSWGTTLSGSLTYNNVFGLVNLTPGVSYSSAINGRNGANNEGFQGYTVRLDALYKEALGAGVSYTAFNGGGRGDRDRDFLSFNVKYSF
ncbi:hypothetical protein D9M70_243550 [compost metagenome]